MKFRFQPFRSYVTGILELEQMVWCSWAGMKNLIFCFVCMVFAFGAMAQATSTGATPAQEATQKMTQLYSLNEAQQADMLKIQERKFRNLAEIEPLKISAPNAYVQKIRSIKLGNDASLDRILNAEQKAIYMQEQQKLREKKALVYKEMKSAGSPQQEIDNKMAVLDLESI